MVCSWLVAAVVLLLSHSAVSINQIRCDSDVLAISTWLYNISTQYSSSESIVDRLITNPPQVSLESFLDDCVETDNNKPEIPGF